MAIDLNKLGKGCIPQLKDRRDFRLELVASAEPLPKEYSLRDKILKIKHQGKSGSCVAQSFAYYAEVLNQIETDKKTELSARDIYSLIALPQNGASLRDGAKKLLDSGVVEETDAASYENGKPPSEEFMRKRDDITPEEKEKGMNYWAGSYLTWDNTNFEMFKRAIYEGNGCVIGSSGNNYCWQNAILQVPENMAQTTWNHATYVCGWKVFNGKEYLEFANSWGSSWGEQGFGYMPKEYVDKKLVFNVWTLKDVPNDTFPKMKLQVFLITEMVRKIAEKIAELLRLKKVAF